MARFERSRPKTGGSSREGGAKRSFGGSSGSRGGSSGGRSFGGSSGGRSSGGFGSGSGRGPMRDGRSELRMTRVTCDACGNKCEVPFRPTEGKPVYCRDCFDKDKGNDRSSGAKGCSCKLSENDLDIINEKLNKIMESLGIQ